MRLDWKFKVIERTVVFVFGAADEFAKAMLFHYGFSRV